MKVEPSEVNPAAANRKHPTAADLYHVQPYYRRFNQKNNMTRLALWDPQLAQLTRKRTENLRKAIENSSSNYRLAEWAYYVASNANMVNSGFNINWPNRHGNSWQPLSKKGETQALLPPFQDFGKLKTDQIEASRLVRKMSYIFGADRVGFCLLDRRWVYSHWYDEETKGDYPIKFSDEPGYEKYQEPSQLENRTMVIPGEMKFVVVFIHEMDEPGIAVAPSLAQWATTLTAYSKISFTLVMVAEFIRGLGYNAIPSANDTALSIPMAVDAGLGELGRNAKLITPKYGPRCRVSKIITDLPLQAGHPALWGVTEFCNQCRKCAESCPAKAIPPGDRSFDAVGTSNQSGVLQWQVDHLKCFRYMSSSGTICGICLRCCPFNKSKHWSHSLARSIIRTRNPLFDAVIARTDNILGYGKLHNSDEFWLR